MYVLKISPGNPSISQTFSDVKPTLSKILREGILFGSIIAFSTFTPVCFAIKASC